MNVDQQIESGIASWFSENTRADQPMLDKLTTINGKNGTIGHFTVMVHDSGVSVGCSASTYKDGKWNAFLLTCDYCANNMIGDPVYVSSTKPAAGCKTGTNTDFPALCSVNEVYAQ